MKIAVMSMGLACKTVKSNPKTIDVVSIQNTNRSYSDYRTIEQKAKNCHVAKFDDVWLTKHEKRGYKLATRKQIEDILDWVEGKDELIVHCKVGKSRSAAVAYLIACKDNDPEVAITILDKNFHIPNEWVVELGAEILGNQRVWDVFAKNFPVYGDI